MYFLTIYTQYKRGNLKNMKTSHLLTVQLRLISYTTAARKQLKVSLETQYLCIKASHDFPSPKKSRTVRSTFVTQLPTQVG